MFVGDCCEGVVAVIAVGFEDVVFVGDTSVDTMFAVVAVSIDIHQ